MTDTSWITAPVLARELGVNRRTLARWTDFPKPRVFHGRRYFQRDEIEAWKKSCGLAVYPERRGGNKNPCLPELPGVQAEPDSKQ